MKKTISILMVLVFVLAAFSACGSDAKKIVGTWTSTKTIASLPVTSTYVFNEDGTGTVPGKIIDLIGVDMTYTLEDGKLFIKTDYSGDKVYTYSFEGDNLILTDTDNVSTVLTRAEEAVSA